MKCSTLTGYLAAYQDSISIDLTAPTTNDFYLCVIVGVISVIMLYIMLIIKNTFIKNWEVRKFAHTFGGTNIAFLLFLFDTFLGVLLAILVFLVIFLVVNILTGFNLIRQYLLLNCRKGEKRISFIINTTFTLLCLFFIFLLFPKNGSVFTASCLVISWADSAGEIIGKNLTLCKYRLFTEKSVSGSFGVFIFSLFAFLTSCGMFNVNILASIWKIILSSFIIALLEAFSWRWLDNLILPVAASLLMYWII